ncbi:hypothetical protein C8J56DRAFT_1130077 [Mycena floridula]|nr:hypothetical protein C8J56DRAFT_1130077 [Mycena floridula]
MATDYVYQKHDDMPRKGRVRRLSIRFEILRDYNDNVCHLSSDPLFAIMDAVLLRSRASELHSKLLPCQPCQLELHSVAEFNRETLWRRLLERFVSTWNLRLDSLTYFRGVRDLMARFEQDLCGLKSCTIIALLGATFLARYSSCLASLESLKDLVINTESAARESLDILENDIVIEVNHSLARISLHNCRRDHRILLTTPWYIYPFAHLRLLWSIRAASRTGRALLNKMIPAGPNVVLMRDFPLTRYFSPSEKEKFDEGSREMSNVHSDCLGAVDLAPVDESFIFCSASLFIVRSAY